MPPAGYLRAAAELCKQHRVLLLLDEIQTGLGRTGRMFASQHEGVTPTPISWQGPRRRRLSCPAVAGTDELIGVFEPGSHGSTFGGNPSAAPSPAPPCKSSGRAPRRARRRARPPSSNASPPPRQPCRPRGPRRRTPHRHRAHLRRPPFCEAPPSKASLCKETHDKVLRFAPLVITQTELDFV